MASYLAHVGLPAGEPCCCQCEDILFRMYLPLTYVPIITTTTTTTPGFAACSVVVAADEYLIFLSPLSACGGRGRVEDSAHPKR